MVALAKNGGTPLKGSVLLSEVFTLTSQRGDRSVFGVRSGDVSVNTSLSSTSFGPLFGSAPWAKNERLRSCGGKHLTSSRRRLTRQFSGRYKPLALPMAGAAPLIFLS